MSKANYPQGGDVEARFTNTGIAIPADVDFQAAANAAASLWEEQVEWYPYLAGYNTPGANGVGPSAEPTARVFNPPGPRMSRSDLLRLWGGGRILRLDGGILTHPTVTIGGAGYTEGAQYWLKPDNADARGRAWTRIEFLVPVYGMPQQVSVTAVWGRFINIPDIAWRAVLDGASYLVAPEIGLSVSKGLYEWREGDELERYGGSQGVTPLSKEINDWAGNFWAAVDNQMRIEA